MLWLVVAICFPRCPKHLPSNWFKPGEDLVNYRDFVTLALER